MQVRDVYATGIEYFISFGRRAAGIERACVSVAIQCGYDWFGAILKLKSLFSFQVEDAVLVTFDPKHSFFVIFTTSHTLHFLHYDSMKQLGLKDAGK